LSCNNVRGGTFVAFPSNRKSDPLLPRYYRGNVIYVTSVRICGTIPANWSNSVACSATTRSTRQQYIRDHRVRITRPIWSVHISMSMEGPCTHMRRLRARIGQQGTLQRDIPLAVRRRANAGSAPVGLFLPGDGRSEELRRLRPQAATVAPELAYVTARYAALAPFGSGRGLGAG